MKRVPFALGMEGTIRATNVLGAGQAIYNNSMIISTGWGALSTDSGTSYNNTGTYALQVNNSVSGIGTVEVAQAAKKYTATQTVNGVTYGYTMGGSGYVTYADSGVWNKYVSTLRTMYRSLHPVNQVQFMTIPICILTVSHL